MNPAQILGCVLSLFALVTRGGAAQPAELRIGMIGLDTSHVTSFSNLLHDKTHKDHVPGARIVGAFKGGSPDVAISASRIEGFTKELVEKHGIKLYATIEELVANVDAVMIESVDGRTHLEQARKVFPFKKPVFIDKPVAGSLRDAIEIYQLARQHGVPVFSSSPLRYSPAVAQVRKAEIGKSLGAFSYGPGTLEPHHPDLFFYMIHASEVLFTVMGGGCEQVSRTQGADADVVTGVWSDGRIGTMRGNRGGRAEYGLIAFGTTGHAESKPSPSHPNLLAAVLEFFRTGHPPVSAATTLEIFAFMEAADESKRRGGAPVKLLDVLKANGGSADLLR
jgi:predicted dehydrogenase